MAENSIDFEKLTRYFKDEYTAEGEEYLKQIFDDTHRTEELNRYLRKHWYELLQEKGVPEKNLDHILYRIHYEVNTKEKIFRKNTRVRNFILWSARIAAILILPLFIWSAIYFYNASDKSNSEWVEVTAPAWTRAQFSLPDGTIGWLNSNSKLRYKSDFIKDRSLSLNGEAFFDVKKNNEKPFVVNTNEIKVIVLGTRFNISAYENEKNVEVVLEEGRLVVNNKEENKSFTMKPNDLVVYDKTKKDFSNTVVYPQKYLAWTEGKLVFRNDPLDVIARRLGRWYNVDVEMNGNNFEDVRLRATFVDENLEEVLYYLKRSLPVDYRIIVGGLSADNETYSKKKIIFTIRIP